MQQQYFNLESVEFRYLFGKRTVMYLKKKPQNNYNSFSASSNVCSQPAVQISVLASFPFSRSGALVEDVIVA